ncbi:MAG: DUF424 family protein [Candidatus Micrarchaeia archaeon]
MLYFKKHRSEHGDIIAMCDKDLLGKIFRDKKSGVVIDLEKYAAFYKGEEINAVDALKLLNEVNIYSGNIVGNESVTVIIKAGLATGNEIKKIENVPTIHIYKIIH